MKKNIVIIFGGVSCEHDISIITALQTRMNIYEDDYNVKCVYICKNGCWKLIEKFDTLENFYEIARVSKDVVILPSSNVLYYKKKYSLKEIMQIHCVVNCMHGLRGEDGSLSALLNLSSIPYTSSDVLGSVLGLDKCAFKTYLSSSDIPVIGGVQISQNEYFSDVQKVVSKIERNVGYPLIIKPSNLGSSIGIKVCKNSHDLPTFIENALKFDKNVLIEKFLPNIKEYNIAIYDSLDGRRISSIESPKTKDEILSFNNKYLKDKKSNACYISKKKQEKIPKKLSKQIVEIAEKCYDLLRLKGVVRFDFIFDVESEKLYLNEINTIPGSMANYLFGNVDKDFGEQLSEQIEYAIHQNIVDSKLISHFSSSVLEQFDLSAIKKFKK